MATITQIRDAFYNELTTAVSAHIGADSVVLGSLSVDADLPVVSWDGVSRPAVQNSVGNKTEYSYDGNGNATSQTFYVPHRLTVDVEPVAADTYVEQDLRQEILEHFFGYSFGSSNPTQIHTDVELVNIPDVDLSNYPDYGDGARGTAITIELLYEWTVEEDVPAIEDMEIDLTFTTDDPDYTYS